MGTVRAPDFSDHHYELSNGHVAAQDALLGGYIQSLQVHTCRGACMAVYQALHQLTLRGS